PDGPRDVQSDGRRMHGLGQVPQLVDNFLSIDLLTQGREDASGLFLEHAECCLAEPTALDSAQPQPTEEEVVLRLLVRREQFIDELTGEVRLKALRNLIQHRGLAVPIFLPYDA